MEAYTGAITSFAVMLFAYDLSGSATAAGGLGTLSSAISYGLAMFGGVLVDSYDRRRLMAIRVSLSLLIWGTMSVLAITGVLSFLIFSVLVCSATVVSGLLGLSGESALRSLVSGENYVTAAGFRWILKSRQMTALTALAVVVNVGIFLLMSSVTLMLLANGTDTTVIGFVVTAQAAGVVLGSPSAAHLTKTVPTGRLLLVTNLASVLFLLPIVFSQNLVLIGVCYFLWGLCVPVTNASLGGYLFQLVPTDIQGRVVAAHTLIAGVPVALTSVIAGSKADAGWGVWAIASGVVCAMLGLSILFIERSLLAIPRPADWPSEVPN
ncbi:MFS transporter [Arcanobacterium phocae]|uniref:MFS transporter n=1 Tax=Arcanobacterium phocae TaxID=131112 RepID=UPI001C11D847|nr:MFS transporter [Arcanobacterium phocae]